MLTTSLFEAKTHLSRIVERLVQGEADQVIVSRRGKPVVRMTAQRALDTSKRIGIARGRFRVPDDIDGANPAIAAMFGAAAKPHETAPCRTVRVSWDCHENQSS